MGLGETTGVLPVENGVTGCSSIDSLVSTLYLEDWYYPRKHNIGTIVTSVQFPVYMIDSSTTSGDIVNRSFGSYDGGCYGVSVSGNTITFGTSGTYSLKMTATLTAVSDITWSYGTQDNPSSIVTSTVFLSNSTSSNNKYPSFDPSPSSPVASGTQVVKTIVLHKSLSVTSGDTVTINQYTGWTTKYVMDTYGGPSGTVKADFEIVIENLL